MIFSTLSMNKPCYIKLNTGKFINIFKAIVTLVIPTPKYSLDISMNILGDDGILVTRKEIEDG